MAILGFSGACAPVEQRNEAASMAAVSVTFMFVRFRSAKRAAVTTLSQIARQTVACGSYTPRAASARLIGVATCDRRLQLSEG